MPELIDPKFLELRRFLESQGKAGQEAPLMNQGESPPIEVAPSQVPIETEHPQEPIFEPGASPQFEPKGITGNPDIDRLFSKEAMAQLQSQSQERTPWWAMALQASPRLKGLGSAFASQSQGRAEAARDSLATRMKMLKDYEDMRLDKRKDLREEKETGFKESDQKRKEKFYGDDDSLESLRTKTAQQAAVTMYPKAKEQILGMSKSELDDMMGKSPFATIYKEEQDKLNSATRMEETKRYHRSMEGYREKRIGGVESRSFQSKAQASSNAMRSDQRWKEAQKAIMAGNLIGELVEANRAGNSITLPMIKTKMARGAGEVGVLTEQDVTRYGTSPKLAQKAMDKWNGWVNGTLSVPTTAEIEELVKIMNKKAKEEVGEVENEHTKGFANRMGVSQSEAYEYFGLIPPPEKGGGTGKVKMVAPNGDIKLVDEKNVEAAIRGGGKRVE